MLGLDVTILRMSSWCLVSNESVCCCFEIAFATDTSSVWCLAWSVEVNCHWQSFAVVYGALLWLFSQCFCLHDVSSM